jgi:superfamily II DNA/RNA helicase
VKKQLERFKLSQGGKAVEYLVYVLNSSNAVPTEIPKPNLGYKYVIYDISKDQELSSCVDVLRGLESRGVVIKLGEIDGVPVYTTLHGDVVFRVIRGRAYEDDLDGRWVGQYIIEFEESKLPNFSAVNVDDLKTLLVRFFKGNGIKEKEANAAAKAIVEGLKNAGFKSLALWQYKAIENILSEAEDYYYVIDAPTATGKTLVFMVPAIAYALAKKLRQGLQIQSVAFGFGGEGALLVYPRKSLQKQQPELLLKILHHMNKYLKDELGIELTVAIDKGVAEEQDYNEKEIAEIDLGNGLQGKLIQVRTRSKVGGSEVIQLKTFLDLANKQRISLTYFKGMALHRDDRNYILSQSPDILITNPWTIRERVKSTKPDFRNSYIERGFIVFDEAHVYVNINYLDLVAAIKLYRHELNSQIGNQIGKKVKFVLSSATIPLRNKKELAQWVLGICKDDKCTSYDIDLNMISLIEYDKLEPDNPNKVLKVIITLLPYRLSIETLVQGIIQILAAALMNRSLKAIVFVDSISEVSTLRKYVDTIFRDREGVEVCDHVLSASCRCSKGVTINNNLIRPSLSLRSDTYDDYSWSHLVSVTEVINKRVDDLLKRIQKAADNIKEHHGALADDVRRLIEQGFAKGVYKILLATSTLDLGVNFDDVTFIVQYKEPISDEALIQRVGKSR